MDNLEHINEFFQTQTLVIWRPGHMGGFLMNLLESDKPNYHSMHEKDKFGSMLNLEWKHTDYFMNYFNVNREAHSDLEREFIRLEKMCTSAYGNEQGKKNTAYLIAVIRHLNVLALLFEIVNIFKNIKTVDDIEKYISQPINNNNFNYVKSHNSWKLITDPAFNSIQWKEKIYCYFPPNKNWLKFVLHFYKLSYYFNVLSTKPHSFKEYFENEITSIIDNKSFYLDLGSLKSEIYPFIPQEEIRHINLYKILFENNYSDLGIDLTKNQNSLIYKAKQDTIKILNLFELDHKMDLSAVDDISKHPAFRKFRRLVIANYAYK